MKLAFATLGCPDWDFMKILTSARDLGYQAIEIRGIEGIMRAEEIPYFKPENEQKTKTLLKEYGVEICGYGSSVKFHDPNTYDANIEEGKQAILVCQRMGIPNMRVFGDRFHDYDHTDVINRAIKGFTELVLFAADKNVNVVHEIHGDFNTLEAVMPVVEALGGYKNFGFIWDIVHSDKIYGDNYAVFYEKIKPYIKHVHIKDHLRNNGDFKLCLTGEGDVPIAQIIERLKADGYNGYYSFEWEKKWHPELPDPEVAFPQFIDYLKNKKLL